MAHIPLNHPDFSPHPHNPYVSKVREHSKITTALDSIWESYRNTPNIVDLGCGNGHFLKDYLELHPKMKGLGVEKKFKRLFKTAEKLADTQSTVIPYDVHAFLSESPSDFWSEVWVQFPDPWPKLRHEKHRMCTPLLFHEIHRILKDGGRFCFRSDHAPFWQFFQDENQRRKLFPLSRASHGDLFDDAPPSLFQRTFQSKGIPIYSLEFLKQNR